MKALIVIVFFIFITDNISAQSNKNEILISFHCGTSEFASKLVIETTNLIMNQNYNEISSFLYSKNSGKVFLGILVLERFDKLGMYILSDKELKIISKLKYSSIMVWNCIGCLTDFNTMKEIFEKDNFLGSEEWLNNTIPN